ncbi:MAG TPA: DEAD/DEAH box helicase, partial [Rugosimonospora sp.]|nr:DEAD/DEAH box helicase [Rugosimonospora sp.]
MTSASPVVAWRAAPTPDDLLNTLTRGRADPLTHVERVPARAGRTAPWPEWVPEELVARFAERGVPAPWQHQVAAAELARAGTHVVVATGTGSGKSLAYQLPVLARLLAEPRATALYLAPTKALAADQVRAATALASEGIRPAGF